MIHKIRFKYHTNSALFGALFVVAVLVTVSCTPAARSLFFDIPEAPPETEPVIEEDAPVEQAAQNPSPDIAQTMSLLHPSDREENRPPIEESATWEEALALLPKDAMGQPDWGAAIREGTIEPRALDPGDRDVGTFKMDFFLKAANPMFDAFFPHSAHLEWMGCDSCHPAVFRYRDNEMSMATINQGQSCGACHGKVAFPVTSCKRCHTNM